MIVRVKTDSDWETGEQEQAIAAANPATDGERGSVVPPQRRRGAHAAHAGGDAASLGTPIWLTQPERSPLPAAEKVARDRAYAAGTIRPWPTSRAGRRQWSASARATWPSCWCSRRTSSACSAECEHRGAADAELHACLRKVAAASRARFEHRARAYGLARGPILPPSLPSSPRLNDAAVARNARRAKISTIAGPRRQPQAAAETTDTDFGRSICVLTCP